jgi:putative salt-induced outer membrane protein YdiY
MRTLTLALAILTSCLCLSTNAFADVHNESELGSTIVSGNTSSETYNLGQKTNFELDGNIFKLRGRYLGARANGGESARNWDAEFRYERRLTETLSSYASHLLESDIFSGYVQRNSYDIGLKYFFAQSPDTTWFAELGYRNSFTQYVTPTPNAQSNYLRIYTEFSQAISDGIVGKLWTEYLPSFTDSNDYLINGEPSISIMLNHSLSLKAADLFKYHNVLSPTFTKRLDSFFTLSLVAKF